MSNDPQVAPLIGVLHDSREGLRQFAVRRLVNLGPQVLPGLIPLLGDAKDYTQESAAIILATLGKQSFPYLLEAMKNHPDRSVRWGAAWVLASMSSEARKAVPPVAVPETMAEAVEVPERKPSDMWSDAWLTKVREQLAAARQTDVLSLRNAHC
jgi:HEAT repeat protein